MEGLFSKRPVSWFQRAAQRQTTLRAVSTFSVCQNVLEALAELFWSHPRRAGKLRQALWVVEITAFQADHVAPGAFVAFAVDVDTPGLHTQRLGINHLIERQRLEMAAYQADDRPEFARLFRTQELH